MVGSSTVVNGHVREREDTAIGSCRALDYKFDEWASLLGRIYILCHRVMFKLGNDDQTRR